MPAISPFLHTAKTPARMALWTLAALLIPALNYTLLYQPLFLLRLLGFTLLGIGLEAVYGFLRNGSFSIKGISSGLTAALLVCSVPATVPFWPMLFALIVSIWLIKLPGAGSPLRFNAAMAGRLFLMLAFSAETTHWGAPSIADVISCATPQEIWSHEGQTLPLLPLLFGKIGGSWEGLFQLVPGSPGETFAPVLLLLGILLCVNGIAAWRTPLAFLLSFMAMTTLLGDPPLYNLITSATLFSAVFIVTDPVSTPMSKSGKWIIGALIGISNALLRHVTFYTEAIVFAVLIGNLFTPLVDRLAFSLQSRRLRRRAV